MLIFEEEALHLLHRSQVIAIPTETVWGLAARVSDEKAVEKIFALKGRPPSNPLIIHVSSIDMIEELTDSLPEEAKVLMHTFWPGSLTLVLPIIEDRIPSAVRASLPTAAFRMPSNKETLALIEKTGPLVAPSANISGRPSATTVQHVEQDFGSSFPMLATSDSCDKGIESTILIWTPDCDRISCVGSAKEIRYECCDEGKVKNLVEEQHEVDCFLQPSHEGDTVTIRGRKGGEWYLGRPGALHIVDIEKVLGRAVQGLYSSKPLCPGQHLRHYSPRAKLYLYTTAWKPSDHFDGLLGFEDRVYEKAPALITMGRSTCPISVGKRLYEALREIDDCGLTRVFVDGLFPRTKEWQAIHDRLQRAAERNEK